MRSRRASPRLTTPASAAPALGAIISPQAQLISADSVVPGDASGGMDDVALKGLTVDFHEPGFVGQIAGENGQPFWFQMSGEQRQQAGSPWGPSNPQALNRYSYVQNGPINHTDPTGHTFFCLPNPLACLQNAYHAIQSAFQAGALDIFHAGMMYGRGGPQVTSKTLYNKNGVRIDVENPNPRPATRAGAYTCGKRKVYIRPLDRLVQRCTA